MSFVANLMFSPTHLWLQGICTKSSRCLGKHICYISLDLEHPVQFLGALFHDANSSTSTIKETLLSEAKRNARRNYVM